jgi:hypothetical protein
MYSVAGTAAPHTVSLARYCMHEPNLDEERIQDALRYDIVPRIESNEPRAFDELKICSQIVLRPWLTTETAD